jgi:hypothetical protein
LYLARYEREKEQERIEKEQHAARQARAEIWETMTPEEQYVYASTPTSKLASALNSWREK